MTRFAVLAGVWIAVTVLGTSAIGDMRCLEAYEHFNKKLEGQGLSADHRTSLQRWSLRAYNACQTGDVDDLKKLLENLEKRLPG